MRYTKISIIIKSKQNPPYFVGSQLRGALGYSLKKVTCINPSYICNRCFANTNCLYYDFYEKKNTFHKFRFDFELGKGYYDFSFYLFDDVTEKLPYVLSAFYMMLTQTGLGKDRVLYKEFDMYVNSENCLKDGQINLPNNFIKTFQLDNIYQDVTLQFITPLRIKKENRFIRDDGIELKDIIGSIYRRQMQILGFDHKKFPYEIKGNITLKELRYKELKRLSNRQKITMNLGGIIGSVEIKGLNSECYELLRLGELLGVGKQTVFGLGKLQIRT